jgi:hypothetical protein
MCFSKYEQAMITTYRTKSYFHGAGMWHDRFIRCRTIIGFRVISGRAFCGREVVMIKVSWMRILTPRTAEKKQTQGDI